MVKRFIRRLQSRLIPVFQSDSAFIEAAYLEILGRPADQDGLDHYRRLLREGLGRTAVLLSLMRSEEFTQRRTNTVRPIPDLRTLRPGQYRETIDRTNGNSVVVFDVRSGTDFDWLERQILEHCYYEQPGVWNLGVDVDKRVVAEIIATFQPARALELGCAAGAVLDCLHDQGVHAEGVEISSTAIARAAPRIRSRIHQGDVLSLDLPLKYDMVFGLDVFEHLNPNRIEHYLQRLSAIADEGGWFFCNIPAFGRDAVFGTVFPLYVDGWEEDAASGRPFSAIHVDDRGYPIHGHLIWADAVWWVARFESVGLLRELAVEQVLHRKYDHYMERRSPARRAYFVFSKRAAAATRKALIERIASEPSKVLAARR
jgi:hypothetical protein